MPPLVCIDLASAGAITSAKRIGVSSGTMISRGVCALRANRRRDRVAKALALPPDLGADRGATSAALNGVVVRVVIVRTPWGSGRGAGRVQAARLPPVRRR